METKSNNSGQQNRQGGKRSGKGQNRNRNRNRNRNSRGGNQSRGKSNNRNNSRNRNRSGRRRRPEPQPTAFQKFLSVITFGLLGKPKRKKRPQKSRSVNKPAAPDKPKAPHQPRKKKKKDPLTGSRLYVGNLSYDVVEDDLEVLFNGVGNVKSAEVVTNSKTQQSKGFAFVEMGTIEEAQRAMDVLDDEDFKGRRLNMNGAQSEGPRDESDSSADEGPGEGAE